MQDWGGLPRPVLCAIFRALLEQYEDPYALASAWRRLAGVNSHWCASVRATPVCVEVDGAQSVTQDFAAWLRAACVEVLMYERDEDEEDPISSIVASPAFLASSGHELRVLTDVSLSALGSTLSHLPKLQMLTVHQDAEVPTRFWKHDPLRCLEPLVNLRTLIVSGNMPTFPLTGLPISLHSLTLSFYLRDARYALRLPPELHSLRHVTVKVDVLVRGRFTDGKGRERRRGVRWSLRRHGAAMRFTGACRAASLLKHCVNACACTPVCVMWQLVPPSLCVPPLRLLSLSSLVVLPLRPVSSSCFFILRAPFPVVCIPSPRPSPSPNRRSATGRTCAAVARFCFWRRLT